MLLYNLYVLIKHSMYKLSIVSRFLVQTSLQQELLSCVSAIIEVSKSDCADVSLGLFTCIVSVIALHRKDTIKEWVSWI